MRNVSILEAFKQENFNLLIYRHFFCVNNSLTV